MNSLVSFALNERLLLFTKKEIQISIIGLLVQNLVRLSYQLKMNGKFIASYSSGSSHQRADTKVDSPGMQFTRFTFTDLVGAGKLNLSSILTFRLQ